MNQDQNYITIEMNLKVQMKDYRLVLGAKKVWIVIAVTVLSKLALWLTLR